jgi:DNA-binding transcriptional regulator LsrR (DeoR family)
MTDQRILQTAHQQLTPNQHAAWIMSIQNHSQRHIALHLGISRTTAIDRIDRAWQILNQHGIIALPSGQPALLEETTNA